MLVSHKYKLIFYHIPKNAGTWFSKLLMHIDPNVISYVNPINSSGHIQLKYSLDYINNDTFNDYIKIAIIRNPLDKLVSYYKFIKTCIYHSLNHIFKDLTFNQFIDKFELYSKNDIEYINCEHSIIIYILDNSNIIPINSIILFENLIDDTKKLLNDLNIDIGTFDLYNKINGATILTENNIFDENNIKIINKLLKKDIDYYNTLIELRHSAAKVID